MHQQQRDTVLLILLLFQSHRAKNYPPGPRPIPILGNLLLLNLENPVADLQRLAKRYGNVYTLFMGPRPMVVISGVQAIKEALVNKAADFSGRPQGLMMNHALQVKAPGVVLADYGSAWKEQRRFGLMALRNFGLGKQVMEHRILGEIHRITQLLEQSVGKSTDLHQLFHKAASNIICQVLFARQFDYDDEFMEFFTLYFSETSKMLQGFWGTIYDSVPMLRCLPLPFQRVFDLFKMARERYSVVLAESKVSRVPGKPRHFIDCYLDELDKRGADGSSFTEDQLCAFMLELHFGGTDTTANTVLTGLLYLMNYPHVQERCQQEIDKVLDGRMKPVLKTETRCPMCRLSFMRSRGWLTPSLSVFSTAPPETQSFWDTPYQREPLSSLTCPQYYAFMPFSTGPRICLGESLARMELFLILVTLLRKFTFVWPEDAGEPDFTPIFGLTQTPKPYRVKIQLRGAA
ncbi:hypothetical protein Q5P01_012101 [Channa striata]|uniref:Uncharacterized protein n=1 Tax=Channa striata TaxID=64152 RepID=A0AA88MN14_CHASR|nr:hypothetical protein Q5P01_012101 [Channa striata]